MPRFAHRASSHCAQHAAKPYASSESYCVFKPLGCCFSMRAKPFWRGWTAEEPFEILWNGLGCPSRSNATVGVCHKNLIHEFLLLCIQKHRIESTDGELVDIGFIVLGFLRNSTRNFLPYT